MHRQLPGYRASSSNPEGKWAQPSQARGVVAGSEEQSPTHGVDIIAPSDSLGNASGRSPCWPYFENLIETDWKCHDNFTPWPLRLIQVKPPTQLETECGNSHRSLETGATYPMIYYKFYDTQCKSVPEMYSKLKFRRALVNLHSQRRSIVEAEVANGVPLHAAWTSSKSFFALSIVPAFHDPNSRSSVEDLTLEKFFQQAWRWSSMVEYFGGEGILFLSQPSSLRSGRLINVIDIIESGTDVDFRECTATLRDSRLEMKKTVQRLGIVVSRTEGLWLKKSRSFWYTCLLDSISWSVEDIFGGSRTEFKQSTGTPINSNAPLGKDKALEKLHLIEDRIIELHNNDIGDFRHSLVLDATLWRIKYFFDRSKPVPIIEPESSGDDEMDLEVDEEDFWPSNQCLTSRGSISGASISYQEFGQRRVV